MTVLDARTLPSSAELRSEICIVGAGAAGIVVAVALAGAGRDVCLIESGGFAPEEATQRLYDLPSIGYPIRDCFISRARYYGGSCNLWAGRSMRLEETDLSGDDAAQRRPWPITYAELVRYYPRAAALLRLPSLQWFDRAHHLAAMSAHERQVFALDPLVPTVSLWARQPMRFGATYRAEFRRSPRIRLVLHANVTRIALNGAGSRVESLDAATLGGRRLVVRAGYYVLACGGLENARLLLVSRDVHAQGIGNAFDLVGRYFMDHPRVVFGRVRLHAGCHLPLIQGRILADGMVQVGIGLSVAARRREGLPNHYVTLEPEVSDYTQARYQSFIRTMKVLLRRGYAGQRWHVGRRRLGDIPGLIYLLTPKEIVPHAVYRWYARGREALRPRGGGNRVVVYFCEQPPDFASRVTLSHDRDVLQMNKLVLDWRIAPEVTRGVLRLQDVLRERFKEAAVGELECGAGEPRFTDASHHMGTTRMSDSPRRGVVDADCRVHGVNNLFVAGSSVFPSAGHANPTLTIVALALRLAEALSRRREAG